MAKTANVGPPGFSGLAPYLAAAAKARGVNPELAGKANLTWHAKNIQNALGSVAEARKSGAPLQTEADILAGASSVAYSLIALAEGCVNAVADVAKRHGLDVGELTTFSDADQIASLKADLDAAEADAAKAIGEAKAESDKAKADLKAALDELAETKAKAEQDAKAPASVDPKPQPPSK